MLITIQLTINGYSAAANWPQAPSMSLPRVSLTVVEIPFAINLRTNSFISASVEGSHFVGAPLVGLSGFSIS